jgi:hypothetical protein
MKLLPCAATLLLAACATYRPPPTPTPRGASQVSASMGETWDAVIDLFAMRNIPIRTIERASGLIGTEPLDVGDEGRPWANCGAVNGRVRGPNRATYNVLVRGDSNEASVRATVLWIRVTGDESVECTSTYVWERELESGVKTRAELQLRRKVRPARQAPEPAPEPRVASAEPTLPAARPARDTIRTPNQLLDNLGFRRAMSDAQRIGIVTDFREVGRDTLAVELADLALTSPSTDHSLGLVYLAYRGTTDYRPSSAMELFHDGQAIGWYNTAGLSWGMVR